MSEQSDGNHNERLFFALLHHTLPFDPGDPRDLHNARIAQAYVRDVVNELPFELTHDELARIKAVVWRNDRRAIVEIIDELDQIETVRDCDEVADHVARASLLSLVVDPATDGTRLTVQRYRLTLELPLEDDRDDN